MSSLSQWVHAIRRRWMIRQLIEFAAIGFASGSVLAISLICIEIGRNHSAIALAIIFPLLGALFGALLGFRSLPTEFEIVARIDRVAGSDDLISTAWHLWLGTGGDATADLWHQSIISSAALAVQSIQLSAVLPRWIGRRGWSVIMLVACAVSALAALSVIGDQTSAQAASSIAEAPAKSWTRWTEDKADATVALPRKSAPEAKAESSVDSRSIKEQTAQDSLSSKAGNAAGASQANQDAIGFGQSRYDSEVEHVADWTSQAELAPTSNVRQTIANTAEPGAYDGRADENQKLRSNTTTTGGVAPLEQQPSGFESVATDKIPDHFRTICRDYFSFER